MEPANDRLSELDGLRGLAAVVVVAQHLVHARYNTESVGPPWLNSYATSWLGIFSDGRAAVIVFFVLSGFVLSLPWMNGRPPAYRPYLVKRVCRIWIPFVIALTVATLLKIGLYHGPPRHLSCYMTSIFTDPASFRSFATQALLVVVMSEQQYNPVSWSLVYEMQISLIFPILMMGIARRSAWTIAGVGLALASLGTIGLAKLMSRPDCQWTGGYLWTVTYLCPFLIGAAMAKGRAWIARCPWWLSLAIGAACIDYRIDLPSSPRGVPLHLILEVTGAAALIASALADGPFRRLLRSRPVDQIGRWSYSLYLYHVLLMLAVMTIGDGWLPFWGLAMIVVTLCLPLAWAGYECIEVPAIQLGKWLTRNRGEPAGIPIDRFSNEIPR
ncbi:MAG: putative acyltransferase [Planctomycetota bacterium]|nr:putative acyltransferase [Planctomycetota bacterium]